MRTSASRPPTDTMDYNGLFGVGFDLWIAASMIENLRASLTTQWPSRVGW